MKRLFRFWSQLYSGLQVMCDLKAALREEGIEASVMNGFDSFNERRSAVIWEKKSVYKPTLLEAEAIYDITVFKPNVDVFRQPDVWSLRCVYGDIDIDYLPLPGYFNKQLALVCECGSAAVPGLGGLHSYWCPLYSAAGKEA